MSFLPTLEFSSEKIHNLSNGTQRYPHTSVEATGKSEIIVVGGNSFSNPNKDADSVIIDTVSSFPLITVGFIM